MAITFDTTAGTRNTGVNSATITLAWAAGSYPSSGALLLVQLVTSTVAGTLTLPDGSWALIADYTDAANATRQVLARRWYTGGDPTSYSFLFSSSRLVRGALHARNGVATGTPIDAGPTSAASTTTTLTHSLATATAGALLLGACGKAALQTSSPSAGWTERYEITGTCCTELAEQSVATPATVSGTWTHSASGNSVVTLFALRDAGAGAALLARTQVVTVG